MENPADRLRNLWRYSRLADNESFASRCDESGIRTHASEETGALNQRLGPLGHLARLTRQMHVDESTIESAQAEFAVELLRYSTRDADSALVISPYAMGMALAIASEGASSITTQQINSVIANGIEVHF
ncbi:unnamed protein product [Toxocara canis]|uniref:SERPIN domain-containing protein n=1 Tax=Toxocara canis TaxID=6265 RepID=A0A183VFM3_TOXCA|nr:unnamed protein product [Toxocara canis]